MGILPLDVSNKDLSNRRFQFTLKTLLWLMAGCGCLAMADWPDTPGFFYLLIGGAIVGGCLGTFYKRPYLFALLGFLAAYPIMTLGTVALVIAGIVEFD